MSKPIHVKQIRKKRKREEKLRKLREKFKLAKTNQERQKILDKVGKIAPWLKVEDFLAPLQKPILQKEKSPSS